MIMDEPSIIVRFLSVLDGMDSSSAPVTAPMSARKNNWLSVTLEFCQPTIQYAIIHAVNAPITIRPILDVAEMNLSSSSGFRPPLTRITHAAALPAQVIEIEAPIIYSENSYPEYSTKMARNPIINTPSDMPNSDEGRALCCRDFNKRTTKSGRNATTMYISGKNGSNMANSMNNSGYLNDTLLQI